MSIIILENFSINIHEAVFQPIAALHSCTVITTFILIWKHGFFKLSWKFVALLEQNWTRMWANAQCDGRPAEYRWSPLFNATKFGWRPLLESRSVTLPRRETRWKLQGCPKLANRSQPLVGRSSPYYQDLWRTYCCLTSFSDCRYMP